MSSSDLIDRIVANVLTQLSPGGATAAPRPSTVTPTTVKPAGGAGSVSVAGRLVTADLLVEFAAGQTVIVAPKAIVTPAAWDVVRDRDLKVQRGETAASSSSVPAASTKPAAPGTAKLMIVVRSTPAVEKVYEELAGSWRRELLGCPDDAAKLAIGELSRGAAESVLILAEQTLRAACLANRSDKVKAVPVGGAGDVKSARTQLKVNTWCLDPGPMSYFELRNTLRMIEAK